MNQEILELSVGDGIATPSHKESANLKDVMPAVAPAEVIAPDARQQLVFLSNLVSQIGRERRLNGWLQTIMEDLVQVIPGAERGALLLRDRESEVLLLKAYISSDGPAVDMLVVHRAMEAGRGFIWQSQNEHEDSTSTLPSETAIYAPLLWQGEALGVIWVDTTQGEVTFTEEDVHFLSAVACCLTLAIVNYQLQEETRHKTKLLDRLLKNFSPKIREKLLERAHHGQLRPGGKKSEVTILYADIRGFTRMSAERDAEDVMDILNAYFSTLIKILVKYDGTIDKFIGDEILAVFGSPEPDAKQHEKAVRAAWDMQLAMNTLNVERSARGEVTCEIGIGIHCGEVLHGFIGSSERIEFTVIGDAVNRASRYCDGAGAGEVLISPEVYQRVWQMVKEERTITETKHEGTFPAYRIKEVALRNHP
jgi:adenylate cyclase